MIEAFIALAVTIFASVVGLKLVGIELIIPLQNVDHPFDILPLLKLSNVFVTQLSHKSI